MNRFEALPLILGASARAAAASARRAGLRPWCGDLFADCDLARCCPVRRVPPGRYPAGLWDIARQAPAGPWMYTGALENHPELVEQVSRTRPLWGNPPHVLREIRDPLAVAAELREAGLACPECRRSPERLPHAGQWLVKPLAGAAGRGIQPLGPTFRLTPGVFFQQWIRGTPHAAIFLADGLAAALLGVTRQLIGEAAFHARPFAYCGSIGPVSLSPPTRAALVRLGSTLAGRFGLRGLFGIDLVLDEAETAWPVEINPRYTASMELLERAGAVSLLDLHRVACEGSIPLADLPVEIGPIQYGKAILYAPQTLRLPPLGWPPEQAGTWPELADLPWPAQTIRRGQPLFSSFAAAPTTEACRNALEAHAHTWLARIVSGAP